MRDPFAAVAGAYEAWYETPLGAHADAQELTLLRRLLAGEHRGTVVEIGAGTGHVSRALAGDVGRIVAVEPSPAMRAEGARRSAGYPIVWVAAAGERLPLRDGAFDGALMVAVLEFVDDPQQVMREAFRVVRAGGWVVVGWLDARASWTALYRAEGDRGVEPWASARFFTLERLSELAGRPPEAADYALWAGPFAEPPFEQAEAAGRRAGHPPAFGAARWRAGSAG
ncbi:MAG: class I SAM-dependent methyltransferase [Dehalococcoidia bacterium]|nr:class I SAM-dependent methyltransferase [Dehalococcoidia bacterium]